MAGPYGKQPIWKRVNRNSLAENITAAVGASTSFNAGDFLTFNLTTGTFGTLAGESDSRCFAGVAVVSIVNGKPVSPYTTDTDAAASAPAIKGPEFGDEVYATLKAGDAVVPGSVLYYNSGATPKNGVTVSAGTKPIGQYFGPSLTGAPSTGTVIPIKLFCNFTNAGFTLGPVCG